LIADRATYISPRVDNPAPIYSRNEFASQALFGCTIDSSGSIVEAYIIIAGTVTNLTRAFAWINMATNNVVKLQSKINPETVFTQRLLHAKTPMAFWYDHAVSDGAILTIQP
jgi:hypothetical protein